MSYRTGVRRVGAWLFVTAFTAGALAAHHHSLSADIYEGGHIESDHDHVLSSHDPLSRATHFHAILGIEHDSCAACHGVRGLGRPSGNTSVSGTFAVARLDSVRSAISAQSTLHPGSSRGPPSFA